MKLGFYHSSFIASKGKSEKIPYSRTECVLVWTVLSGDGLVLRKVDKDAFGKGFSISQRTPLITRLLIKSWMAALPHSTLPRSGRFLSSGYRCWESQMDRGTRAFKSSGKSSNTPSLSVYLKYYPVPY